MPDFPTTATTRQDLIVAGNNDVDDLASDIDSVQTNVTVGTNQGAHWVVGQSFVIDQEAFHITGIAGDILTVERGFDNTTPTGHTAGSGKVVDRPIAGHHNIMADELAALLSFFVGGWTADLDAGGFTIDDLADPTEDQQPATKGYVDDIVAAGSPLGRFALSYLNMGA